MMREWSHSFCPRLRIVILGVRPWLQWTCGLALSSCSLAHHSAVSALFEQRPSR